MALVSSTGSTYVSPGSSRSHRACASVASIRAAAAMARMRLRVDGCVENHETRRPNSKGCALLRATRASPRIMARGSPVKDTEPASAANSRLRAPRREKRNTSGRTASGKAHRPANGTSRSLKTVLNNTAPMMKASHMPGFLCPKCDSSCAAMASTSRLLSDATRGAVRTIPRPTNAKAFEVCVLVEVET